jgi:hypothetical protein
VDAGLLLDPSDPLHRRVERRSHGLVHELGLVPNDEVGRPSVATKQLLQLLARNSGEKRRIRDLVAVEMQDRQHRAIGGRIEKLVGMPGRGQRARLRLAIANDAGDDERGVVEHGPESG